MMKARITVRSRYVFEMEAATTKELFEQIAAVQDVFDIDKVCGCCKKPNLRYRHRVLKDGNEFYECVCEDCRAVLMFGTRKGKDGQLFPKRKDRDDNWLENDGWSVYKPDRETANV